MECKDSRMLRTKAVLDVLIETLWNVKREEATDEMVRFAVLIETLWNVKLFRI